MKFKFIFLVAVVACGAWFTAQAGTPNTAAKTEIDKLMASLDDTCRFQRNGTWYDAAQARDHLQTKYDWLLKRGMVDSAEQFIDRAASKSSMSGKAYRVSCPGGAEQDAGPWFLARLQRLREVAKSPPKP
jgi:hypothetical protein